MERPVESPVPEEQPKKRRRRSSKWLADVKVCTVASPFTLRVTQLILANLRSTDDIPGHVRELRRLAIEHASKEVAALPPDLLHLVDEVRRWEEYPGNPLDPEVLRNGGQPHTPP